MIERRNRWRRLALLAGLLWTGAALAATFTRDVSIDARGHWAVTVSADGVARLHDLTDDRASPIPAGGTIRWTTAAMSADGQSLALAGNDGANGRILVLDRSSGRPLAAWSGAGGSPADLAFSADGTWLAVGYRRPAAVVLHLTADWQPCGRADLAGLLTTVKFRPGSAMLYALVRGESDHVLSFSCAAHGLAKGAQSPPLEWGASDIAFSPDGQSLAVAFNGKDVVELRSAEDFTLRQVLPSEGAADGRPGLVAWLDQTTPTLVTLLKRYGGLYLLRQQRLVAAADSLTDVRLDGPPPTTLSALPDGSLLLGHANGELKRLRLKPAPETR